jgi:hypothetical protein
MNALLAFGLLSKIPDKDRYLEWRCFLASRQGYLDVFMGWLDCNIIIIT